MKFKNVTLQLVWVNIIIPLIFVIDCIYEFFKTRYRIIVNTAVLIEFLYLNLIIVSTSKKTLLNNLRRIL